MGLRRRSNRGVDSLWGPLVQVVGVVLLVVGGVVILRVRGIGLVFAGVCGTSSVGGCSSMWYLVLWALLWVDSRCTCGCGGGFGCGCGDANVVDATEHPVGLVVHV